MATVSNGDQPLLTTLDLQAATARLQALSVGIADPRERRRMISQGLGVIWRREHPFRLESASAAESRVIDAVLFCGEWELLAHRVSALADVTDKTLVVEADRTFAGEKRAFALTDAELAARGWQDRVVALRITLPDWLNDRNLVETWQRNHIALALAETAGPSDLVLIGDIDELPFPGAINANAPERRALGMRQTRFFANHERIGGTAYQHFGAVIVPVTEFEHATPSEIREDARHPSPPAWTVVADAGIHLQYVTAGETLADHLGALGHTGDEIERVLRDRDRVRAGTALDGYACLVPDCALPGELADVDEDRLDAALEFTIALSDRRSGRRQAPVPDHLGLPTDADDEPAHGE
ncbi:hypothetical protein [Thalassobaculum sp.]|uniref:hypothetical protein n=1 Tax=Thalassobaculum sp. TaxID=2022740 RepID=UPI0032F08F60